MKINSNRLLAAAITAALSLPAFGAGESETSGSIETGYDSNPYRLSSGEESGRFVKLEGEWDFETGLNKEWAFFSSADGSTEQYFGSVKDATEHRAGADAGVKIDLDAGGNRLKIKLGVGADAKRGTFVSRFTGEVGRIGLTEIPDRFDYNRLSLFGSADYYMGTNVRVSLDLKQRDKNYVEDYGNLGADRLDYRETLVRPAIRYTLNRSWEASAFTELKMREYDSRTVDDALGNRIAGSNREYDYREYGFEVEHRPAPGMELNFGFSTGDRQDNGGGYWDYDATDYFVSFDQELDGESEYSVELYRTEKDYDNVVITVSPDEQYSRSGNGVQGEYSQRVQFLGWKWLVHGKLDYFDGSSSSDRAAYKRTIAYIGVSRAF